ncbi:MAG: hypothetical protein RSE61_00725 [Anaerovoracaceae bacterium]
MNTKKIIIIIVIVLIGISPFIISSLSSNEKIEDSENTLKSNIFDFYEDLRIKYDNSNTEKQLSNTIKNFLTSKSLTVNDLGNNLLLTKFKAVDGYKDADSTTLHISYSLSDKKKSAQVSAIAFATLINSSNHGDINLLITPENKKSTSASSTLKKADIDTDNIINLTHWNKSALFNGSAFTKTYRVSKPLTYNYPSGTKAYKIEIANLKADDSGDRSSKHTNPIVFIGDLLASAKASGTVMEIAEFTSSNNITDYPTNCKALVVIDESNQTKFTSKLEASKNSFKDKNRNRDAEATFEYEEVAVPDRVISLDDTSRLLSLLYTLVDGVYATTEEDYEGDTLALTTIASIDTTQDATLDIMARTVDKDVSKEMDSSFKTIANLSDFNITKKVRYPLWEADVKGTVEEPIQSEFTQFVQSVLKKHSMDPTPRYNFVESEMAYMHQINKKANMISIGINIENAYDYAKALTTLFEEMKKTK